MSPSQGATDVTGLLHALRAGEGDRERACEELYGRVYDQLHALAEVHRARWQGNETLNTTAILHEAYLKLVGGEGRYEDRSHFLAVASKAMRQVLYTYAQRQAAQKRGGKSDDLPLDEAVLVPPGRAGVFVALEEALVRLEAADERAARVVECRFFGGLTVGETADALGVSARTVAREWAVARSWLYGELAGEVGAEPPALPLGSPP